MDLTLFESLSVILAVSSLWMMAGWNYYTQGGNEEKTKDS